MPNPVEAVTWSSELLKMAPAVLPVAIGSLIGGLLAISGGVLSQVVIYRLNGKRDKAKLKREKLEALVQALYEHADWLEEMRSKLIYSTEPHDVPSPLDKAWMLKNLYFPELSEAMLAIEGAALPLTHHCREQRIAQLQDRIAWLGAYDHAPCTQLHLAYHRVFLNTVKEAGQLASEYADV